MFTSLRQLVGRQRWLWPAGWLLCAVWAGVFPLVSPLGPHRDWGVVAAAGYLLAAVAAAPWWRRDTRMLSAVLALVTAGLLPLALALRAGAGQSEVTVIGRAGTELLTHGSPYLDSPTSVLDLTPCLPGMAAFGLPHALLGPHSPLGDPRLWCAAAFLATAGATWHLLRGRHSGQGRPGPTAGAVTPAASPVAASPQAATPPASPNDRRRARRPGPRHPHAALRTRLPSTRTPLSPGAVALVASPVVALPLAVSGVDLPMTGLLCLALALAARRRAGAAGLALAAACALKWTAWPAVPVAVALLAAVAGRRAARRCAGVAVTGATALMAPWLVLAPGPMVRQVFAFPLGLGAWRTPAASPLPGRLLAQLGTGGWWSALALLLLGGGAVAVSLVRRPPADAVAAADRLAVGLALAFLLAPAGRYGYLALPLFLAVFTRLASHRAPTPRRPAAASTASTALPSPTPRPGTPAAAPADPPVLVSAP
ncbi:glycosyltransferase 87 family protein [Kitasatospora griseola]|uniref:glycosyltransferase 87 family protein n=1 Tax=Kitasatospora griseola TaxID=2064 RepID=UPI0038207DF0